MQEWNCTTVLYHTEKLTEILTPNVLNTEIIKLLEYNIGNKLLDIGLGDDFLGSDTKNKGNKSKNTQIELYKKNTKPGLEIKQIGGCQRQGVGSGKKMGEVGQRAKTSSY